MMYLLLHAPVCCVPPFSWCVAHVLACLCHAYRTVPTVCGKPRQRNCVTDALSALLARPPCAAAAIFIPLEIA